MQGDRFASCENILSWSQTSSPPPPCIQLTLHFFYFIDSLRTCYCFLHAKEALHLHMHLLMLVNYVLYVLYTHTVVFSQKVHHEANHTGH